MDNLSALLSSAKSLNAHISRPDQPLVTPSLEQIESDSRNLVARLPHDDRNGRATYFLARGNVDVLGLGREIADIDTVATFKPLEPLADSDVQGYLRHVHEQTLISTIEESRRETQAEFYRLMEERMHRDWEYQKSKLFEELGTKTLTHLENKPSPTDPRTGIRSPASIQAVSVLPTLQTQSKMMAYDRVVSELNKARLKGAPMPLVHRLMAATKELDLEDSLQAFETFQFLANIVNEPPYIPSAEHSAAHALNTSGFERKYAHAYLADQSTREAISLRRQIAMGAKRALENQYETIVGRAIQSNPVQAQLGGDPSYVNRVRAFVFLRYYKSGRWDDRVELIRGQPEWAKLFFLVRIGRSKEALEHALSVENALNEKEPNFVAFFKIWVESGHKKIPPKMRDRLQTTFNSHILHAPTSDPFKLVLFKLIGRLDPTKRNVAFVTTTSEDWLWLQLAMLDDEDPNGLPALADVILGYGERHFEVPSSDNVPRKGVWARVLLICGFFEMAVAALYSHFSLQVEAVHLAIALAYYGLLRIPPKGEANEVEILSRLANGKNCLNISLMISRYVRQFIRSDPREALQYIYCIPMASSVNDEIGKEQLEISWELVRRVITATERTAGWEELVGGFSPDGTRLTGAIEHSLFLLGLENQQQYNEKILFPAAAQSESEQKLNDAIRLYNLAGARSTVISCLARALGDIVSDPTGGGEEGRELEVTARNILHHYDRVYHVPGRDRDAVVQLLGVREAMNARSNGRFEAALETLESTEIIPLNGDTVAISTKAAQFREQDDAVSRNLHIILPFTMELLEELHQKIKTTYGQSNRGTAISAIRKKARALMLFAGTLRYRLAPDVHSYLAKLDVSIAL